MCTSVYALYLYSQILETGHYISELPNHQKAEFTNCEVLLSMALNLPLPF